MQHNVSDTAYFQTAGMTPTGWETDAWALGNSVYEMASGKDMFHEYPGRRAPWLNFDRMREDIRGYLGEKPCNGQCGQCKLK